MEGSVFSAEKTIYGENYNEHIMQQYKVYVEMADRISQRRMAANAAYVTLITTFLAFSNTIEEQALTVYIILHTAQLLVCFTWYYIIRSYRQLNSGKYKVIHEIEIHLPLRGYAREWELLKEGKNKNAYWPLTHIEKYLPISFSIVIIVSLVWKIILFYC